MGAKLPDIEFKFGRKTKQNFDQTEVGQFSVTLNFNQENSCESLRQQKMGIVEGTKRTDFVWYRESMCRRQL